MYDITKTLKSTFTQNYSLNFDILFFIQNLKIVMK